MSDKPTRPDENNPRPRLAETVTWRANEKRELLTRLLENGIVMVRLDARRPGVQVPPRFAEEFDLPLDVSRQFAHASLLLDSFGVTTTLRFAGAPFRCALPWSSIWAIRLSDGAFHLFKGEMPVEADVALNDLEEESPDEPARPRLSVVSSTLAPAPASDEPAKPRAPWLRLVR